jgi:hypothetical protein
MRRIIVQAAVAALVCGLLAVPASANMRHFAGTVNGGGTVKFDVKFKHGKARKAGAFAFKNVPEKCDEATIPVATSTDNFVKVKHRRFHYRFRGFIAHVRGKITNHGRKAHGVFLDGPKDIGTTPTNHNCHTGSGAQAREIGWRATR